MKIILLENIKGLGNKFDVKDVKDGYARNSLFVKQLAEPATAAALKELETLKKKLAAEEAGLVKRLNEIATLMHERKLEFPVKTDEKGNVFGSVTKESILKGLRDAGFIRTERVEIKLEHPLKELGIHKVPVDLKKGITAELTVEVTAISP